MLLIYIYKVAVCTSLNETSFRWVTYSQKLNASVVSSVKSVLRKYIFLMKRGSSIFNDMSYAEMDIINTYKTQMPILMRAVTH